MNLFCFQDVFAQSANFLFRNSKMTPAKKVSPKNDFFKDAVDFRFFCIIDPTVGSYAHYRTLDPATVSQVTVYRFFVFCCFKG